MGRVAVDFGVGQGAKRSADINGTVDGARQKGSWLRRSVVTAHYGDAPPSLLAIRPSASTRDPSQYFNRLLRLVALVLPLGEQRELVRCPIRPSGWHGRRVAFVRRKCFEHFVSIVRIGHEGVIVQLYAVRLHVRNIDIAKQWPDITRERNLGHNVLLPTGNAECEICKQNIKTKLSCRLISINCNKGRNYGQKR